MDDWPAQADRVAALDRKLHREVAAGHVHGDAFADETAVVRDGRGGAGARAAAERLSHPALPHAHVDLVGGTGSEADELDVGALREALVDLEMRAVLRHASTGGIVDEQHEVRVTHT